MLWGTRVWTIWGVVGAFCVWIWASRLSMRTWFKSLECCVKWLGLKPLAVKAPKSRCPFPDNCFQTFLNSLLGSPSALPGQYWLFHRAPTEPYPDFYQKRVRATRPQLISQGRPWRVWTQSCLPCGCFQGLEGRTIWGWEVQVERSAGVLSISHCTLGFWKMKSIQYLLFLFFRKFMYIREKWNISISNKKI